MSATLGRDLGERLAALLADDEGDTAPLLVSAGRQFPVKTTFLGAPGLPGDPMPQLPPPSHDTVLYQPGVGPASLSACAHTNLQNACMTFEVCHLVE